jgi:hypothetical protein
MFNSYSVGVSLSLINHVTPGLNSIIGKLAQTEAAAKKLQDRLSSIKAGFTGGIIAIGAGLAMAAPFKIGIDHALKFEKAMLRIQNIGGMDPAMLKQIRGLALSGSVKGAGAAELIDLYKDLHVAFGDSKHAFDFLPEFAKANMIGKSIYGKNTIDGEKDALALARVAERRGGGKSPAVMHDQLDLVMRMRAASGGVLGAQDLDKFSQQMGTQFRFLSNDGIAKMMAVLAEMKGSQAGTAITSAYQNLLLGRGTEQAGFYMRKNHLVDEAKNDAELKRIYGAKWAQHRNKVTAGGAINAEQLKTDFVGWVIETAVPALRKNGITKDDDIAMEIAKMMSNRKGSSAASLIATQIRTIMKDYNLVNLSKNMDGQNDLAEDSAPGKFLILKEKWDVALTNLGVSAMPLAISTAEKLTKAIDWFNKTTQENPELIKNITNAFMTFSAVLVGGGVISILASATRGLWLLGSVITMVGGAAGIPSMTAALTACLGPIGLVVTALGLLYVASQAFKPISQKEADAVRNPEHPQLTPEALARSKAMGWKPAHINTDAEDKAIYIQKEKARAAKDTEARRAADMYGLNPVRTINNTIVMPDGRVLANVVTKEQAREATRPQLGTGRFDFGLTPPSPGMAIR